MAGLCLDGKVLAQHIEQQLARRVQEMHAQAAGRVPTLATILVGDDPASATYVRMKGNACKRVGMRSLRLALPQNTSTAELLEHIRRLNADADVHGILLQHPVPHHIDERRCFDAINLEKDVDGVTCHGFGRLAMGVEAYGAATAAGIMRLLQHYTMPVAGKHAVVVGRSPILGRPLAMMLSHANATVTVCHSRTVCLPEIVRQADLVVGAVGRPIYPGRLGGRRRRRH